jgi:hypothetical protein
MVSQAAWVGGRLLLDEDQDLERIIGRKGGDGKVNRRGGKWGSGVPQGESRDPFSGVGGKERGESAKHSFARYYQAGVRQVGAIADSRRERGADGNEGNSSWEWAGGGPATGETEGDV